MELVVFSPGLRGESRIEQSATVRVRRDSSYQYHMTYPIPSLTIRRVGNGPKQSAMWLDGAPCMVKGLDQWPKVGERLFVDGLLYRVVEVSDRFVLEWEPS